MGTFCVSCGRRRTDRVVDAAPIANLAARLRLLDGGYFEIMSGPRPDTTADALAPRDAHVLASLQFGDPAFAAPIDGLVSAHPLTPDSDSRSADADDAPHVRVATWFRLLPRDRRQVVLIGSVQTKDGGLDEAALALKFTEVPRHVETFLTSYSFDCAIWGYCTNCGRPRAECQDDLRCVRATGRYVWAPDLES